MSKEDSRSLDALQPDGNEGTVTVESGQGEGGSGGAAADGEELELKNLCEDVVCSQLLKRVASLKAVTCCCQEEDCEVRM